MDESKYKRWVEKILATEEEEISCSVCFDLVSDYVEAEFSGMQIEGGLRQVRHHLDQCKACYDEYELLRDFLKSEADSDHPAQGDLNEPD